MQATPLSLLVATMLSFELSVMDIVLAAAIIIVLLLHLSRTPTKSTAEPKLSREERKPLEESRINIAMLKSSKKKELVNSRSQEDPVECPHHFGFLKTLTFGSSVPEGCYGCSQMIECLRSNVQKSGELEKIV